MPHTVIVDNAGGHLMQRGRVDLCIVGTDRTTAAGDVANKIGTYLKALAAHDNGVPFYVALPSPTIDWSIARRRAHIPIEERDPARGRREIAGALADGGDRARAADCPTASPAANFAFDVTPARLVTGAHHRARRLRRLARGAAVALSRADSATPRHPDPRPGERESAAGGRATSQPMCLARNSCERQAATWAASALNERALVAMEAVAGAV